MSNAKLHETSVIELTYVAENLIPPGVFLLAADPKIGKSTFARSLAVSVAAGRRFANRYAVNPGPVLYISTDESQSNVRRYEGKLITGLPPDIPITWVWKIPHGDEALRAIRNWLAKNPDARLVVIDILENIRNPFCGGSIHQYDTRSLEPFKDIAADYPDLCILLLHHTNKNADKTSLNAVSGSNGLAGTSESIGILTAHKKDGVTQGVSLSITSRHQIESLSAYTLNPDTAHLEWQNPRDIVFKTHADAVKWALSSGEALHSHEIADGLGIDKKVITTVLWRLQKNGEVEQRGNNRLWQLKSAA